MSLIAEEYTPGSREAPRLTASMCAENAELVARALSVEILCEECEACEHLRRACRECRDSCTRAEANIFSEECEAESAEMQNALR